jgi:hypothetical protein
MRNLGQAFLESEKRRVQFRISMQTPVDNPLMTIESFNRQFQVGDKEREGTRCGLQDFW